MRAEDWSAGSLGPADAWTQPLRTAIEVALNTHSPMLVVWGHDYVGFPNDAFQALIGGGQAQLGRPWLSLCASVSAKLVSTLERAYAGDAERVAIDVPAGGHFDISCTPLRHRNGAVGGAFCTATVGAAEEERLPRSSSDAPGAQLAATTDLPRLLHQLVCAVIELQHADSGDAHVYEPETGTLHRLAQRGFEALLEDFAEIVVGEGAETASTQSLAAVSGGRVIVDDVSSDERFPSDHEAAEATGIRAIHSTPLHDSRGELVAVVSTYFRAPHRPTDAEVEATDAYLRQAADIVAARLREGAQQRRAIQLQAALDAARMGTWEWQPERDVLTLDARAREILGESRGAELRSNRAFEARIHSEDLERRREAIRGARDATDAGRFAVEFRWLRPDGRQLWIEQAGRARMAPSLAGTPVARLTGILSDVTERRASEEALEAASLHKDRFLATLAHELRNPLAPLRYAAELLRGAAREDLNWSRDVIDRQVAHLTRLIDDLFDISRITRELLGIQKQRLELAEVVQTALESCRPVITQNGQQLIVQLPSDPIYVAGDPVRLTQVIVNLLKNASKFTQREGRIRVKAARRGGEGVISVQDSGVGIAPTELPHVFDVFYQGKTTQGGLGIGLYLAKRLVELHGGTIEAASEGPGSGSEFVVRLPIAEEAIGAGAPGPDGVVESERPGWRVLVVDDDPDSADALARLLRLQGSEVQTAYDGLAAMDAAEQFRPHVVLLDLEMPRLDGFEACKRLRRQPWAARMRLVALSGWGRSEDRARTRDAGFDGHLVKPVGRADVEALLEEWRE